MNFYPDDRYNIDGWKFYSHAPLPGRVFFAENFFKNFSKNY